MMKRPKQKQRQHVVVVQELNMSIKLELEVEQVNGILMALGKAPYEMAQPIIDLIKQQAIPQVQPVTPAEVEVMQ